MGNRRLGGRRVTPRGVSPVNPASRYRRARPANPAPHRPQARRRDPAHGYRQARGRLLGCAVAAVTAATALSAAACSSGPAPAPTPRPSHSPYLYGLAIAQCAIDRGLIPARYLDSGHGRSYWLRNGRVTPNAYFSDWWNEEMARITVAGMTLEEWELGAEQRGRLPAQICGAGATPVPVNTPGS